MTMTRCLYCGADIELPPEGAPVPSVRDDEAWRELAEKHYRFCPWILTRAHRVTRADGFAMALGFDDYEALCQASESIVSEGDVDWFVTRLPDGRWAAWEDAELSLDRVEYFDTREEAIEFHQSLNVFARTLIEWERAQRGLGGMVEE